MMGKPTNRNASNRYKKFTNKLNGFPFAKIKTPLDWTVLELSRYCQLKDRRKRVSSILLSLMGDFSRSFHSLDISHRVSLFSH